MTWRTGRRKLARAVFVWKCRASARPPVPACFSAACHPAWGQPWGGVCRRRGSLALPAADAAGQRGSRGCAACIRSDGQPRSSADGLRFTGRGVGGSALAAAVLCAGLQPPAPTHGHPLARALQVLPGRYRPRPAHRDALYRDEPGACADRQLAGGLLPGAVHARTLACSRTHCCVRIPPGGPLGEDSYARAQCWRDWLYASLGHDELDRIRPHLQ